MNNTVVIKPVYKFIGCATLLTSYTLKIDCQPRSSIIISDNNTVPCEEAPGHFIGTPLMYKFSTQYRSTAKLIDVYINVNSILTCESLMMDSECLYMLFPGAEITFAFNDCEYYITLEKDIITFSSVISSMYAIWLAFCGRSEKMWLANVLAQPQGSGKPSIEILTKTLQGIYSSKRFNLEDFDIKHIPYIKDVYTNCTYEFLEDTIHLLDKEQIVSIVEELGEEDGERKVMLIQAAGLKENNEGRFEL